MSGVLSWAIRRLGVWTLLALSLLFIAGISLAMALLSLLRGLDAELAITAAIAATLAGWVLAKSPLPGPIAALVGTIWGTEFVLWRAGHLGGRLATLVQAVAFFVLRAWELPRTGFIDARPVVVASTELWQGLVTLVVRLVDWVNAAAKGVSAFDPVAAALFWSGAIWVVMAWAGWAVTRRHQAFEAMLPATALAASMLAFAAAGPMPLVALLAVILLAMIVVAYNAIERHWESAGIAYAEQLGADVALVAIPLSLGLVLAAAWTPSISVREIVDWAQRMMEQPAGEVNRISDALGVVQQPRERTALDTVRSPGLPRDHLIGAGPELSKRQVMFIRTDDLRPVQAPAAESGSTPRRYYWRNVTYDLYSGSGWSTSSTEEVEYLGGQYAISSIGPGYRRVRQDVELVGAAKGLLYSTGVLATVNRDYRVAWRTFEDSFGAGTQASAYRAESWVPGMSESQLRAAGTAYPEWIRNRYLDLPQVPARVHSLALSLTATERTPYDRARAIEAYLRTISYTLDVRAPPRNREVADFFLFDLKKGYCDYYATTMVVLARAAGLPARLVVGYAPGTLDERNARYVITEADAHSWVEVYFPGYGWIEFEPTGGRAPLLRDEEEREESDLTTGPLTRVDEPSEPSSGFEWLQVAAAALAALAFGLLTGLVVDDWRLRHLAPKRAIHSVYGRFCRLAHRLDVPQPAGQTPNERAAAMSGRMRTLAEMRRLEPAMRRAQKEAERLTTLYVRSCYSSHLPSNSERDQAIRTWKSLRARLWFAWLWQMLGQTRGTVGD